MAACRAGYQSASILTGILLLLSLVYACDSQPVYAQSVVVPPITAQCATSVDGSVVGTINPLSPPILTTAFTGTLPSGNYYVQEAWIDAASHTTLVSPETPVQLTGTGELIENPPSSGIAATVVTRAIYIGTSSGSETLQGTATGSTAYTQSVPLVTGAVVPSVNNTVCQVIANDAGWPTGTGYTVGLTTPAGSEVPGYPLQAQFLGPGNSINLGQGFPLYNGTVTYPIPLLARPYNHGPQSISGNLSLGAYQFSAGGINANSGFTYAGAAPLNHILCGNGAYYVDCPKLPSLTPTFTIGSAAGTGATINCSGLIGGLCTDLGGLVLLDSGSSPTSGGGVIWTIVFGNHSSGACTVTPSGQSAAAIVASTWSFPNTPGDYETVVGSTLSATTQYEWAYTCVFQ